MGPFTRATGKVNSGQKRGGQSSKESSSKGLNSPKETDQKTYIQRSLNKSENRSKDGVDCSSSTSGISLAKTEDSGSKGGQKEKVQTGHESIYRTSNLQKEPSQVVYSHRSRGRNKTKLEDDADILGEGNIGNVIERIDGSEVADPRGKSKGGKQRSHAGSLQDVFGQAVSVEKPWKPDEDESNFTDLYANISGMPVAAEEIVERRDSKTGLSVAGESSDLHTSSLSLSLGLNRIKTRSGPLCEDGSDGTCERNSTCSEDLHGLLAKSSVEGVDKSSFSKMRRQFGLSSKQLENISRRDSYSSPGKGQCERSNEALYKEIGASSGDFRSRDRGVNSGSRIADSTNSKLQRSVQSPQRSSFVRGNLDGLATTTSSQFETHSNPFSSTSQLMDYMQLKSKESQKTSLKKEYALEKKIPCRFTSYIDGECSKDPVTEGSLKQLDVIKETESTRFQAVPKISEGSKKKKWPKDIKSFSHELGPRGSRPYGHPRPHSDNDLEELLGALRARFNTAKEEVDSELAVFAVDLIEILDKNADSFPEWQEKVEDLLVLARRCTVMSASDFRRECESIVQELDDKRQELPMGLLKQLHTRMLFILTRCTRLLQFQKGSSPEEEGLHKVQQCLKGVPSLERSWASTATKKGKLTSNNKKLLPDLLERTGRNEANLQAIKHSKITQQPKYLSEKIESVNQSSRADAFVADQPTSLNKSSALVGEARDKTETTDDWVTRGLKDSTIKTLQERWDYLDTVKTTFDDEFQETIVQSAIPSKQVEQESIIEEPDSVICRICEEEVPTSHLEAHSFICALADTCDIQGLSLDERLKILADNLEKITELNTPKSYQPAVGESPDSVRPFRFHDGPDGSSPKVNDGYGRVTDARFEDFCAVDTAVMEEPRGMSLLSFKPYLGPKSDQGMATSSAGSGTPRSTLTTPRNSQLDLLWAERSSLTDLEDISQIFELADIARCVANKSPTEDGALEYLVACMQDLQDVLGRNKIEALTVDTFGKCIANLLREKYLIVCENNDQRKLDMASNPFEEEGMSADDGLNSLKSTPTHPAYKDRTTIDDFEILKPISRGAFGRVFLARKRTTGDFFAIKVLRKIDMIRKNAVENILAERDILISVRNPFVVRFFYSFTCRDNLYLVMEYLNGGDLYSLLRNMGCLEEHVARVYIAELVLALEYLHTLGVVHRDLKPDNILIAHDGHIKLTDFGLSKVGLINSTDDLSGPAASGTVLMDEDIDRISPEDSEQIEHRNRSAVGTPDYLAPEILLGTEHGYTADWWSTGIILFECLTGLPPFNAEHPQIIFDNILNRKIPWPRVPEDMSFEAQDLIDKLLTEDPNQRLGAKGATEVKSHSFFKDINWDTLARQKAAFVPNPESVDDTSYFTSRHLETHLNLAQDFADSSDCSLSSASINSLKAKAEEGEDECGDLAEFESSPSVKFTFNNFSFKNLSQLASINYDLLLQTGKDMSKGHSRQPSAS